jgi:hypothetical protein
LLAPQREIMKYNTSFRKITEQYATGSHYSNAQQS